MSIYGRPDTDLDHAREPTAAELADYRRRLPVEMRLGEALAKIPVAIQRKGLPIAVIQAQLRGRSDARRMCHAGELGEALQKRGWARRRTWERRDNGGAKTLWYPPGVDPIKASILASFNMPPGRPPKWLSRARKFALECGYSL